MSGQTFDDSNVWSNGNCSPRSVLIVDDGSTFGSPRIAGNPPEVVFHVISPLVHNQIVEISQNSLNIVLIHKHDHTASFVGRSHAAQHGDKVIIGPITRNFVHRPVQTDASVGSNLQELGFNHSQMLSSRTLNRLIPCILVRNT